MTTLTVVEPGLRSLVQDSGRHGWAHLGVGRSGAADRVAMALANRLVGNEQDAAVIEVTNGGLALRFDAPAWVAVTGAPLSVRVGTRARWTHEAIAVRAGRGGAPRDACSGPQELCRSAGRTPGGSRPGVEVDRPDVWSGAGATECG